MFICGTDWETLYSLVSEQTCTINHKMDKACDKRLKRLISCIHHTCEYRQCCHVGNTAKHCRLGLFQESDFAGDLEDSKSTSGGTWCVFGSHTFVPISWMGKKQTSVSHSSTESEIISLNAGLRLDSSPALDLWDLIVLVLGNTIQTHDRTGQPVVYCDKDQGPNKRSQGKINVLNNIDCVPSNVQSSRQEALLYVFEDNEAVIKMIIKGRSPTMRHVSRTHRVALDWLFNRINLDSKIQIKYIDTKKQLADILSKGNFSRDEWNHFLFNISHFSSTDCSEGLSERTPEESSLNSVIFCITKPGAKEVMKIIVPWVRMLRCMIERWDSLFSVTQVTRNATTNLLKARTHGTNGTITKLGLLKSGKLRSDGW